MSPAEKMDEIVRALEALTEELAAEIEGRYASTKDHPAIERRYRADMEDVEVGRRALTLARQLRAGAVEGWVHPDSTGLVHSYTSADFFLERPHNQYCAALLILSDPNPPTEEA